MPVKHYRYGRTHAMKEPPQTTHLLKIGRDGRKPGAKYPTPIRLAGFLAVHNTNVQGDTKPVDYEAMRRLGYDEARVNKGIELGFKANDGEHLPNSLDFILPASAEYDEEEQFWLFPDTFDAEYSVLHHKDCPTCFCRGNGETASRYDIQTGQRHQITCNPYGKEGVPPEEWCEYSRPEESPCKIHYWLVVRPIFLDPRGCYLPLLDAQDARFLFQSTSELGSIGVSAKMQKLAQRLKGDTAEIMGTIRFSKRRKRKPNGEMGLVPNVWIEFNEDQVRDREVNGRRILYLTGGRQSRALDNAQRVIDVEPVASQPALPPPVQKSSKPAPAPTPAPSRAGDDPWAKERIVAQEINECIIAFADDEHPPADVLEWFSGGCLGKKGVRDTDELFQFEYERPDLHSVAMTRLNDTFKRIQQGEHDPPWKPRGAAPTPTPAPEITIEPTEPRESDIGDR